MCYRGAVRTQARKWLPPGGGRGGKPGYNLRCLLWGKPGNFTLEAVSKQSTPEYPRVTNKVFPALSHGGQSYFKGILKGAVP